MSDERDILCLHSTQWRTAALADNLFRAVFGHGSTTGTDLSACLVRDLGTDQELRRSDSSG